MKRRSQMDTVRESLRLQQLYNTFLRYLMDIAFDRGILGVFRRFMQQKLHNPPYELVHLSIPVKIRLLLEELGPTYVKMGQIVSSRSESLPTEWQSELDKLQSDVPPFPFEDVREIVEEELGETVEELYTEFNPEPLAAASTAQVHRAVLHGGEEVVVKVQRPGIRQQVDADLGIMMNATRVLSRRSEYARDVDLAGMVNEFGTNIVAELDYYGEMYNAKRLTRDMEGIPNVHIPYVYAKLSTSRVLTIEFINGVKVTNLAAIEAAGLDRKVLAEAALRSLSKQLFIDGFFHADPHPGNVLVDMDTGDLTYIDTGMVGEIDVNQRISLVSLLMTIRQGDALGMAQTMLSLSKPFREVDEGAYYKDFERRIGRFMEPGSGASMSEATNLAFAILRDHGLQLDTELTLAIKALLQVDAITSMLHPESGIINMAETMVRELALEQVTSENVSNLLTKHARFTVREAIKRAPTLQEATLKWLEQYEKGRFSVEIDTTDLNNQLDKMRETISLIVVGMVLAGMIIGSAVAASFFSISGEDFGTFLPYLAFGGYTIAMVISIIMVLGLLWRKWRG
jgi:ubiquinone biosynthesis protein